MTQKTKKSSQTSKVQQSLFIGLVVASYLIQDALLMQQFIGADFSNGFPTGFMLMLLAPFIYFGIAYAFLRGLPSGINKVFRALLISIATASAWGMLMLAFGYVTQFLPEFLLGIESDLPYYASTIGSTVLIEVVALLVLARKKLLI